MARLVLLNALPLNSIPFKDFAIQIRRASINDIATTLPSAKEIKCYIRHEATVRLLSSLLKVELKPSAELYSFDPNDLLYIVTLKKPIRGQDVAEINENDIEVFRIVVAEGTWL